MRFFSKKTTAKKRRRQNAKKAVIMPKSQKVREKLEKAEKRLNLLRKREEISLNEILTKHKAKEREQKEPKNQRKEKRNNIIFKSNSINQSTEFFKKLDKQIKIALKFKKPLTIEKDKICKERKNIRKEILKNTRGKGLSIQTAKWLETSKIRCK